MSVAIVIPTSNNLEYLQRCLETLVDYTSACDYRLVVVDNGSSDETPAYLLEVSQRVETEIITNKENLGFIKASNQGIASAIKRDEHVLLLNDDTQITDARWLFSMLFDLTGDVGAVGPVSNYVSGLQNIQLSSQLPEIHETNLLVGFCMLIRNDALKGVGFLDEYYGHNMFDDFDYSIRLRKSGFKLVIDRSVFVYHYGSKTLMREPDLFNTRLAKGEQLLKDKWGQAEWENAKRYPQSLIDWGLHKMKAEHDPRLEDKPKRLAFWIVDGEKWIEEAINSAESLKRTTPDVFRLLCVPQKAGYAFKMDVFDSVLFLSPRQHAEWYADRMRYVVEVLEYIKEDYDSVLELDTDTYFLSPVPELFDMLDHFDIAMALAPGHRTAKTRYVIPDCYSEYNNGVVVERNNQEIRDLWSAVYEELVNHLDVYGDNDQAPLRQILFHNPDIAIATLTAEYNCRFPFGTYVSDEVKILHGRGGNYELIGKDINQVKGIDTPMGGVMRTWQP